LQNYSSYWNIRGRANRARRYTSAKHNVLPNSPSKRQQEEEVHYETDISNGDSDSRHFDLSNEDFPLLPCNCKATQSTQAPLAKIHSETGIYGNSSMSEPSNEDFSLPLVKGHSVTDMDDSTFQLFKEDFPLLPKVCSETQMEGSSTSVQLSTKDFPFLQGNHQSVCSESGQLTKQDKSSSCPKESKWKSIEFGSFKKSQSLTEPSLSTRNEKEDCAGVSLSQKAVTVVPKVATERKEKSGESNEKMY